MQKTIQEELILVKDIEISSLILYNDDYNTFEHVIYCLVKYLNYTVEAAEQSAWIVHTKGKYKIKEGLYDELKKYQIVLSDEGLNVDIL